MARTQATGSEVLDDSLTGDDIDESTLDAFKIPFSSPDFEADNIGDAIQEGSASRFQYAKFQYLGQMNYDSYLFTDNHKNSSDNRRSGDASNGYRYTNCAPNPVAFSGEVHRATASITGVAVSTGAPDATVELLFELWSVGFDSEGVKLGDVVFTIDSSTYNIGRYWNSSVLTAFSEEQEQTPITITAGALLGLKFIKQTGSDVIVAVQNPTVVVEIVGSE